MTKRSEYDLTLVDEQVERCIQMLQDNSAMQFARAYTGVDDLTIEEAYAVVNLVCRATDVEQ